MAALLLLLGGCETAFETSDLRTGMAEREVVEAMGPPIRRSEFPMPGNAAKAFSVLEYPLIGPAAWTPSPYWLLFDRDGLLTFGPGGASEAWLRTVEAYYDWMADNGRTPRAEAERHIHAAFRQAYGEALNPAVDSYLAHRARVMREVDDGALTLAQAEQAIGDKYAELSVSPLDDLFNFAGPPPEGLERAMAVAKLGAVTAPPGDGGRPLPKAARRRAPSCPSSPSGSPGALRCF